MNVEIPEKLFFDLVDLLREPKNLSPADEEVVLHMDKRNEVLGTLLNIRRRVLNSGSDPDYPDLPTDTVFPSKHRSM